MTFPVNQIVRLVARTYATHDLATPSVWPQDASSRLRAFACAPSGSPCTCKPVFAGCEVIGGAVAAALFDQGLCLPSGSAMTADDMSRVIAVVRRVAHG